MSALLHSKLPIAESFASEYLEYYRMLPLELTADQVRVAVAGDPHAEAIEDLRVSYGVPVEVVPVGEEDLLEAIRRTFAASESVVELVRDLSNVPGAAGEGTDEGLTDVRDLANQPPVIRFVNLLIREAHDASASDIHLEATHDGLRVRLRLDGVLTELPTPPRALQAAVVSRIKLLAELDIAERRQPQDGRIRVRLEARELDLRVSTVPTLYGESVVLRLLDRAAGRWGSTSWACRPRCWRRFSAWFASPTGSCSPRARPAAGRRPPSTPPWDCGIQRRRR